MKLLHIDSSILGPNSVSRTLSAQIAGQIAAANPGAETVYRDLAAAPLGHLTAAHLGGANDANPAALADDIAAGQAALDEFMAADTVVIGVAFYNFSVPTQLKAWIDRVLINSKTFRYTAEGAVEGLAAGKRVILAVARGGFYADGAPGAANEHAETYLRAALGFIGIEPEVVTADGIAVGPEQRAAAIADAERQIEALAA